MPRAKTSFATANGSVHVGQVVEASHPLVALYPSLFTDGSPVVEQATAAPGEKRRTRRAPADEVADKPAED